MSETGAAAPARRARPLSPHLQIYRPQITTLMSITHRATGVALALGSVLLVVWLAALATEGATGGAFWTCVSDFLSSALGRFMLMGWIWALFYHLCNGLRHLVWDTGRDMDIASVYRSGYAALVLSSVLTLLCWVYAF